MSPAPSGSLVLQRIKLGDALKIHDGIIFDFYLGLPHIQLMTMGAIYEENESDWSQNVQLNSNNCSVT